MAQLSAAIDGIAEACTALGTPVTGGNVSLYNETLGEGIYPTPVIGVVGILDDVTKAVPSAFQHIGDDVLLVLFAKHGSEEQDVNSVAELGSSAFAETVLNSLWGKPPALSLRDEANLHGFLQEAASERLLRSASDVSDGGIFVTLAKATQANLIGFQDTMQATENEAGVLSALDAYWHEESSTALVSCSPENTQRVLAIADKWEADGGAHRIGLTVADRFTLEPFFDSNVHVLQKVLTSTLEFQLAEEVHA
jgi:phosphoribosylformylglycinamidine (FGAM) synthase-like enzyme